MKLKHVLFTGVLTAVAAVLLLTLVVPQTAAAGGKDRCWRAYCTNDPNTGNGGGVGPFYGTRA